MFLFCLILFLREMRKEKKKGRKNGKKEKKKEEEKREGGEGSHFACFAGDDINDVRCLEGKWLSYWRAMFAVCVNDIFWFRSCFWCVPVVGDSVLKVAVTSKSRRLAFLRSAEMTVWFCRAGFCDVRWSKLDLNRWCNSLYLWENVVINGVSLGGDLTGAVCGELTKWFIHRCVGCGDEGASLSTKWRWGGTSVASVWLLMRQRNLSE